MMPTQRNSRRVTFVMTVLVTVASAAGFHASPDPSQHAPDSITDAETFAERMRASLDRVLPKDGGASSATSERDVFIDVGRGPVPVHVPIGYDPAAPTPVVFLLHGYTSSGSEMETWWQLAPLADEFGFLYVRPDGTSDFLGNPFWNATDACCDLFGDGVDDSAYLKALLDEVKAQWNVDPRRVFFAGHSNGGFMSYRMACDYADEIAAVASLAGATWSNPGDCGAEAAVHVLQIHGTSDGVIGYDGGCIPLGGCHPGAVESVEQWAGHDGCELVPETDLPMLDLTTDVAGPDANVSRYATDCVPGGSSELWSIPGGVHSPNLSAEFGSLVIGHLLAHPKPCLGDSNGDETIDVTDLLALLGQWGGSGPADLDGSGLVDVSDLLVLLGAWGGCA